MTYFLTFLYLSAIVLANLSSAAYGPQASIYNAFLFIGLTLSTRDRLHDLWGRHLKRNMALLILGGGLLSYLLNADAGRIALASVAAFAASETLDALTYHFLRRKPFLTRSNGSNVVGAAVDSLTFAPLAFGGFPWPIMLGQFVAKVLGGALWSLVLNARRGRRVSV